MADSQANFAYSLVATAPAPATSGTSLVVTAGNGTLFPTPPFNATVWPAAVAPTSTNAEIVRVTNISTDTLTITRAQESSSAQSIAIGYQIMNSITALSFSQYLPLTGGSLSGNLTIALPNKLLIATGSNASAGIGTLVSGVATIATTAVTSNSLVFVTDTSSSTTNVGSLTVSAKTAATNFVVTSTNTLDTSTFNWFLIN